MTRVSLKEAYDNKDVIAQIYAIRDTAESAEDTAEQAVTTANTASDHVDALVPQVEGAVQNANSASASAQASAQTVAGYENRLATAEGDIDDLETDLNAVTLRVTTAEGQIVTIQGRVTALETADGQNIKISNVGQYAVTLSDYQIIPGLKVFEGVPGACNARNPNIDVTNPPDSDIIVGQFVCLDRNNVEIAKIIGVVGSNGVAYMNALVRNQDGTYKAIRLITGD